MFFADFKNNKEHVKINSILTPSMIRNFIKDSDLGTFSDAYVDMLTYKLPDVTAQDAIRRLKNENDAITNLIKAAYSKLGEQYSPTSYDDD